MFCLIHAAKFNQTLFNFSNIVDELLVNVQNIAMSLKNCTVSGETAHHEFFQKSFIVPFSNFNVYWQIKGYLPLYV